MARYITIASGTINHNTPDIINEGWDYYNLPDNFNYWRFRVCSVVIKFGFFYISYNSFIQWSDTFGEEPNLISTWNAAGYEYPTTTLYDNDGDVWIEDYVDLSQYQGNFDGDWAFSIHRVSGDGTNASREPYAYKYTVTTPQFTYDGLYEQYESPYENARYYDPFYYPWNTTIGIEIRNKAHEQFHDLTTFSYVTAERSINAQKEMGVTASPQISYPGFIFNDGSTLNKNLNQLKDAENPDEGYIWSIEADYGNLNGDWEYADLGKYQPNMTRDEIYDVITQNPWMSCDYWGAADAYTNWKDSSLITPKLYEDDVDMYVDKQGVPWIAWVSENKQKLYVNYKDKQEHYAYAIEVADADNYSDIESFTGSVGISGDGSRIYVTAKVTGDFGFYGDYAIYEWESDSQGFGEWSAPRKVDYIKN